MRKLLLLALPLASLLLAAGCAEEEYQATSSPSTTQQPAAASAPAPAPAVSRNTTTQPLPAGWNYLHDSDMANGPLKAVPAASPASGTGTGGI